MASCSFVANYHYLGVRAVISWVKLFGGRHAVELRLLQCHYVQIFRRLMIDVE